MAKKKSSSSSSSERAGWLAFSRILAFVALLLSIVIFITLAIFQWVDNKSWLGIGWLSLVKDLALIGAILIPAWYFVKPKAKAWHIIYWICVVIIIVFAVLGNQLGFF